MRKSQSEDLLYRQIYEMCESVHTKDDEGYKEEIDRKVSAIFGEFPWVATLTNAYGISLGMIATRNKLERSALRAIENQETLRQQDIFLRNIGMYGAMAGLSEVAYRVREDYGASIQKDCNGWDIAKHIQVMEATKSCANQDERE